MSNEILDVEQQKLNSEVDFMKSEGKTGEYESSLIFEELDDSLNRVHNNSLSQYEFNEEFLQTPNEFYLPFNLDSQSEPINSEAIPMIQDYCQQFQEQMKDEKISECEEENNKNSFKYVMRQQRRCQRRKNGNIPKFICRTLVHKYKKHKKIFKGDPILGKQVQKMVNEEKKKYSANKNANNTLDDLKKFFCDCEGSADPIRKSFLLRKTIHRILRNDLEELVIKNSQIQLRKQYMIYLKTQSLRCRNKTLMCRLKAR